MENIIKVKREEKGILQEHLADLLGISVPNYSKKEAGIVKFSLEEAKKLSDYFSVSIDELFFKQNVS